MGAKLRDKVVGTDDGAIRKGFKWKAKRPSFPPTIYKWVSCLDEGQRMRYLWSNNCKKSFEK